MLIGNKSQHLIFTFENGQFSTEHEEETLYIQDKGHLLSTKNSNEFTINKDGSIQSKKIVLKVGVSGDISDQLEIVRGSQ